MQKAKPLLRKKVSGRQLAILREVLANMTTAALAKKAGLPEERLIEFETGVPCLPDRDLIKCLRVLTREITMRRQLVEEVLSEPAIQRSAIGSSLSPEVIGSAAGLVSC